MVCDRLPVSDKTEVIQNIVYLLMGEPQKPAGPFRAVVILENQRHRYYELEKLVFYHLQNLKRGAVA